ncbi:hypothetical protein [Nitrosophilus labii]|uniref:hypothetical protein n=1 Tax=Nitrosophilus labii TaxID=2706014 RepID=UPI001656BEEF|nr:hypothetical protein [Nitrosophilus labii]
MCKKYRRSEQIVNRLILEKNEFTYDSVIEEIRKENGVMRIAPGVTIRDYLDFLESNNFLRYIPRERKYIRI